MAVSAEDRIDSSRVGEQFISSKVGEQFSVMRKKNMSLHSIHRAASLARHKTFASIKSVFISHGHSKSSPMLLEMASQNLLAAENGANQVEGLSTVDDSVGNYRDRIFDAFNGSDSSSEDEGYYTANDDCREFSDRESDKSSSEAGDDKQEGVSKQLEQKSSSNGNSSSGLDISELRPVIELRDSVIDAESEERLKEVDDATLLRFLKARSMDVAKASEMFIKDWRWRNQFAPQGFFTEDVVSHQLQAEKAFLQGLDKEGRPLFIIIGAKHFSKGREMEEFKRYCFYCIEKVIASMPEGKEQFVTIFDAGATGYKNMDTSASLMMADFLQAHYPERMAKLYMVHCSSLFYGGYRLVEPAIDVNTRKKIVFATEKDMESLLREEIGEECLPKVYGGTADLIPIQYSKINRESYPCKAVCSQ